MLQRLGMFRYMIEKIGVKDGKVILGICKETLAINRALKTDLENVTCNCT